MGELPLFDIVMGLLGGLAIFLFGMEQLTTSMKEVAGRGMSKVLGQLTRNRFMSAITGAFVTAVIQSSSVTTVLVVGFISAGLMTLQQSIGIIMGANIGTTITAQIIAFKVTHYALLLVAAGFGMLFLSSKEKIKQYGGMIMGLGMVFFGMGLMADATHPLRTFQPFIDLMQQMGNPLLGIAVAGIFTALVQSSSATTGIVIVLASQGFITLEAGIALIFGANLGTCVTAILAAIGKPAAAKQAAAVHLAFNILGVLIWIPFIGHLAVAVEGLSPAYAALEGIERLARETPRQIANAHTIFNIANTLIFIGFTTPLAWVITRVIPDRPEPLPKSAVPKYLDSSFLDTPSLALDSIRKETVRLGKHVNELFDQMRPALVEGTRGDLNRIVTEGEELRLLHHQITEYTRTLSMSGISKDEARQLASLNIIAANIQHVGETIAIDMVAIGRERLDLNLTFSKETMEYLTTLGTKVRESFNLSMDALADRNLETARQVVELKPKVHELVSATLEQLSRRLVSEDDNRAPLYRVESRMVELLQRIYYFAKKIGKQILSDVESEDPAGQHEQRKIAMEEE